MIAYLLMKTSKNLKGKLDRELKPLGITSTQFAVMNQIELMGNNALAYKIATAIGSDRPTISAVIHRLHKGKLIVKIDNPSDRRTQTIQLTKKGLETLSQLRIIADNLSHELFGDLDESRMKNFIGELNYINEKLGDKYE